MDLDARLVTAPGWVLHVVCGVVFTVPYLLVQRALGESWTQAAVAALISGAFFGLAFGAAARWAMREQRRLLDLPDREQERAAIRATAHGPVPEDPTVRAAALRLARYRLTRSEQSRSPFSLLIVAGFCVFLAVAAVWLTPWFWLFLPVFLAAFAWSWIRSNRLAVRAADLAAP